MTTRQVPHDQRAGGRALRAAVHRWTSTDALTKAVSS